MRPYRRSSERTNEHQHHPSSIHHDIKKRSFYFLCCFFLLYPFLCNPASGNFGGVDTIINTFFYHYSECFLPASLATTSVKCVYVCCCDSCKTIVITVRIAFMVFPLLIGTGQYAEVSHPSTPPERGARLNLRY